MILPQLCLIHFNLPILEKLVDLSVPEFPLFCTLPFSSTPMHSGPNWDVMRKFSGEEYFWVAINCNYYVYKKNITFATYTFTKRKFV